MEEGTLTRYSAATGHFSPPSGQAMNGISGRTCSLSRLWPERVWGTRLQILGLKEFGWSIFDSGK
jgi:hypothetical protein